MTFDVADVTIGQRIVGIKNWKLQNSAFCCKTVRKKKNVNMFASLFVVYISLY